MKWKIGCSGFYYREWKDVFYPAEITQKNWFSYYCKYFNTIEINSTFYKMPSLRSFEKWYQESPDDFVFTIKAPRLVTHFRQLKDCESLLADFYSAASEGLKEKLACILFQFPPKFDCTEERLALIDQQLDQNFKNVVEFRNLSWFNQKIYDHLAKSQITVSGQSYPGVLPDAVISNSDMLYYRFHGKPVLYKSEYDPLIIRNFADQVPSHTREVFVYFNNTWGLGALHNAKQLQDLID